MGERCASETAWRLKARLAGRKPACAGFIRECIPFADR